MAKLGINVLKEDLTALAVVIGEVDVALEDGKINLIEGVKIGIKSTSLIKVVKNIKEAKAELMDLDGAEKAEIKAHFIKVFDLRNDDAEAVVENIVALAIDLSDNLVLVGGLLNKKDDK